MGFSLKLSKSGKLSKPFALVVLFGSATGVAAWLALNGRLEVAAGVTSLGNFAARCAATLAALVASRKSSSSRLRRSWLLLTMATLFWVVAEGNRILWWLASGTVPDVPSPIDAMRLLGYLFATIGIILYPATQPERLGRTREVVDFAILVSGVMALSWLVFIRPMIILGIMDAVQIYWRALYAVFDMVFVAFILRLILVAEDERALPQLACLGLAFFGFGASDSVAGFLTLQSLYRPGMPIDIGWTIGSLLIVLGASIVGRDVGWSLDWIEARWPARRRREVMPNIVAGVTVGYLIIDFWGSGQLDWIGLAAAGVMLMLMIARGGIIAGQMDMRLYASLVNFSADLGFVCHPDGRFLLINPALQRALGPPSEGDGAKGLREIIEAKQPIKTILADAEGSGWADEVMIRRRDGTGFPAFLSLRPVQDERYTRPLLAGTAHDLTEIKDREAKLQQTLDRLSVARAELADMNVDLERKVEERTRQLLKTVATLEQLNDQLQELDRLKSEFVTLVSHELRAPLTNISGGVEYVLHREELGMSVRKSLALVQEEIDRLTSFVEDILDLSALEAGRFPLHPSELVVRQVVEEVLGRFSLTPGSEKICTRIPTDLPAAFGDRRATESVVFHLVDNAIKYAPEGAISITADADEGSVQVVVADSGPGIPEEARAQVFDMFHRLDTRDAKATYGHGLGLYMARRLMLAQGGGVSLDDTPDGGARFSLRLPRADSLRENAGKGAR
jgi:PAS domain S-box-containing protein